ncbi:aldo/keto reductase [Streptomyces sioyaensis]|uniref:aldo/keto reductase n=1 Tax=Streptomyces sioyaensis TaxID=67364 RepID=UPI0036E40649
MSHIPNVALNSGVTIPQIGFGVYLADERAINTALETGYRSIDTASAYGNERDVGRAIASSGIAREELFVTTKVWNDQQGYDNTLAAFDASLNRLRLDHVDLYLVHWPAPARDTYVETWRALERVHAEGRARAIGVSNFMPEHLRRLFDNSDIVPAVNQIEFHPLLQQREVSAFNKSHGIVTETWSPLARSAVLGNPVITRIADRLGKTLIEPAEIANMVVYLSSDLASATTGGAVRVDGGVVDSILP